MKRMYAFQNGLALDRIDISKGSWEGKTAMTIIVEGFSRVTPFSQNISMETNLVAS